MEDDEMDFNTLPAVQPAPVRKRLSRLKRAHAPTEQVTAAENQSSVATAADAAPRALSDRTNIGVVLEPALHASPPESPTSSASGSPASPSKSPVQDSQHTEESEHPRQTETENDYWDSEDELEAELTRRECAEGFHADSPTSSGES